MYKSFLRPLLFSIAPERIHHLSFAFIRNSHRFPGVKYLTRGVYRCTDPALRLNVMGLEFANPVGLAAGFDKDARAYGELAHFGFGFIEVGTVTPRPQLGNPQPRLFRLPKDKALVNRMGFNNAGVDAVVERLKRRKNHKLIIGGNIGKNKITPNDRALEDYLICFDKLFPYVDYFVVNVSSPNTPDLRDLQEKEPLKKLLENLQQRNREMKAPKPLLLKIAPDLTTGQLDDIVEIVRETKINGIIATNTTIAREGLQTSRQDLEEIGAGGLSGAPLRARATEVVRYMREGLGKEATIIAVGGIFTADDAGEKLEAGADLVQVYTGFIYEGPGLVKQICKGVLRSRSKRNEAGID